jgi:uncharacterized BrkB/YihY/UPF0761 family membrane protein
MSDASLSDRDTGVSAETVVASEPKATQPLRRSVWRRLLRPLILVLTAQYTIVLLISLTVVGTVRAWVLPQILTSLQTITSVLKHTPY